MSELFSDRPRNPDSCSSIFCMFLSGIFCAKWKIIAGSIEPDRVPIIGPSSGVNPIDVSRHFLPWIAARLTPLPRWQLMILAFDFLSSL